MSKYYHFDTMFRSLKDDLSDFLTKAGVYYELSATGYFCGWHFEILATKQEIDAINEWFHRNTIVEVRA